MEKFYPNLYERYDTHQLDNGLTVYFVHKKDTRTHTAFFAIPYGALDLNQNANHLNVSHPAGTAHFLEHKLFENHQGKDVMGLFNKMGAQVNAFTSHFETVYYFKTSRYSFRRELNLLLDFVQDFSINAEAVEKEKGIIKQELAMYHQIPEQRLVLETYKSLYHEHPIRNDIGGDAQSVDAITKDILEQAYQSNYQPSRCVLVLVSGQEPTKLLSWIHENQASKIFRQAVVVNRQAMSEPTTVTRAHHAFSMDIQNSKMTLSFKLNLSDQDNLVNAQHEWCLRFFCELLFSPINERYQTWIDQDRIHDYFGYDVDVSRDLSFVMFFIESDDSVDFKTLVLEGLNQDLILFESSLIWLKRRYVAQFIRSFDDHDDYALNLIRSHFNQVDLEEVLTMIESIQIQDLLVYQSLVLNAPETLVRMHPNPR